MAPVQQRRRPEELRALLIEAASKEFSAKGYGATTNKDIAQAAGVSLSVLYRHFGSKGDIFDTAMLQPLEEFLAELITHWLKQLEEPWDDERLMRMFIGDIHATLLKHRDALAGLVAAGSEPELLVRLRAAMDRIFLQLRLLAELESERRGWFSSEGIESVLRLLVSMVFGVVMFDSVVLSADQRAAPETLRDDMVKLALWGLARRRPN